MLRSADRKILTEQTYSAQRSYGVGRARRVAHLRVRLLVTTDWTARHRRRIRIAADPDELDLAPPSDPRRLAALLDVEERMGATDPYRQLGQLAHLILRKASTPPPEATDDFI